MNLETLNLIFFSPTETTYKIVTTIGQETGIPHVTECNLSHLNPGVTENENKEDTLAIIGMPVYGGRIPLEGVKKLEQYHAKNTPAVIVVVYGNRAYEDALLELKDVAINCGFKVIAAAAFIGEHSFSTENKPIAPGRPDPSDLEKARDFGKLITRKLHDGIAITNFENLEIPGNFPYKERKGLPLFAPETNSGDCNQCKRCEEVCPIDAITVNDQVITDKEACIWCCACIKACPQEARYFENTTINGIREKLITNCQERKEPEYFL